LRRTKKSFIFSKSSISVSRLAAVSLAACGREAVFSRPTQWDKGTHNEEDTNSRKYYSGRGKYLKVIVSIRRVLMQQHDGTDRANALAKGGRECVKDVHGWRKPLGESLIVALRLFEFVGFPLKHSEDGVRRITAFNLLCEWVGGKIVSGLLLVLFEGLIEDRWIIWSSGRYLDVG
jgi:hypothetical protein